MDDGRQNKRNVKKNFFKYTIRIVSGLFTLLWGLVAWAALYPDEDYHHCESGQDEMSATTLTHPLIVLLLFLVSQIHSKEDEGCAQQQIDGYLF